VLRLPQLPLKKFGTFDAAAKESDVSAGISEGTLQTAQLRLRLACPVPANHGVDDDEHVSTARPKPGEHEPEGAVTIEHHLAERLRERQWGRGFDCLPLPPRGTLPTHYDRAAVCGRQ